MAKRKKLKAAAGRTKHQAGERVYDFRSQDAIASVVSAVPIEIVDPAGDKIIAMRATRSDPLAAMEAAGLIDHAQYLGGRHWQRALEKAEGRGAKSVDTTVEAVDGGQIARSGFSDEQEMGFKELTRARKALGEIGERTITLVLTLHMPLRQAAESLGMVSEREIYYFGKRFRECLETLAIVFGYAMRK